MSPSRRLRANPPVDEYFPSDSLVIGAGVVIFHLATNRVVVCKDTRNDVWFLPKGRRDASEETGVTAIREGFEEVCSYPLFHFQSFVSIMLMSSGYRNRLLPLPLPHIQPRPNGDAQKCDTEPIATRLLPVATHYQYMLFWYAAETLPPCIETSLNASASEAFALPPPFPANMTLAQRVAEDQNEDGGVEEPKRHEGTGVDEDEAFYVGVLMGVEEAIEVLGGSSGDVVRRAWEGVCLRRKMEGEK
ncbi:hypothetical protein D6D00_07376 [Aureobasidium pullulans]|nr:hypothetical protein D6D00_07376 [Aureobasidium pullulans]TIA16725.1 hypothetical protein D6C81_05862 [Aureobasidium pullulans]